MYDFSIHTKKFKTPPSKKFLDTSSGPHSERIDINYQFGIRGEWNL